jgi:hypothetical protein
MGHDNHLLGIERLVAFRGPKQHESRLGQALLRNICYSSVGVSQHNTKGAS